MARVTVLITLSLSVSTCLSQSSGFEYEQKASSVWQTLHSVYISLCEDGHGFLVSLFGRKFVDSGIKTMMEVSAVSSEFVANVLNTVVAYGSEMLGTVGINAKLPVKHITPEGVIFVTKWALLAVLAYWILSLAVCLVAGILRRTLWLLQITFAVAMFGLILSDTGASAETTAMRLAGLVFACILLGIGPSPFRGESNTHLEVKVKTLEKRLREVEKKRKDE
ncbi:voltage-gated monoatomic cation channel TMEM109-like [Hoplias malabaricus]|uniref:voltage-gated monoatomic cation channel TMEM109-like n=1 Tax=Hoplias malabaricus TaxID=27720 RepID=UPI0034636647